MTQTLAEKLRDERDRFMEAKRRLRSRRSMCSLSFLDQQNQQGLGDEETKREHPEKIRAIPRSVRSAKSRTKPARHEQIRAKLNASTEPRPTNKDARSQNGKMLRSGYRTPRPNQGCSHKGSNSGETKHGRHTRSSRGSGTKVTEGELAKQTEILLSQVIDRANEMNAPKTLKLAQQEAINNASSVKVLKQQVSKLKSTVYRLEKELDSSEKRCSRANAELQVSKDLLELNRQKLKEQHDSMVDTSQVAVEKAAAVEAELLSTTLANERNTSRVAELEVKVEELTRLMNYEKDMHKLLQEKFSSQGQELVSCRDKEHSFVKEIAELKSRLLKAEAAKNDIFHRLSVTEEQLSSTEGERDELHETIQQVRRETISERSQANNSTRDFRKKLREAQDKMELMEQELQRKSIQLAQATTTLDDIRTSSLRKESESTERIGSLKSTIAKVENDRKAETDSMQERLDTKSQEIQALIAQAKSVQDEFSNYKRNSKKTISELEGQVRILKEEISKTEESNRSVVKQKLELIDSLKAEASELRQVVRSCVKDDIPNGQHEQRGAVSDSTEQLVVDVDLPNSRTVELKLKHGDDVKDVVAKFCRQNEISEAIEEHLRNYVYSQLHRFKATGSKTTSATSKENVRFDASPKRRDSSTPRFVKDVKASRAQSEGYSRLNDNRRLSRLRRLTEGHKI